MNTQNSKRDLTAAQSDRAAGVLLGLACGDALGAPYEFGPAMAKDAPVGMIGGGPFGWAPGEWTDDTQMATVILDTAQAALIDGDDLRNRLDDVVWGWHRWAANAADVGNQTRAVLSAAAHGGAPDAASSVAAAQAHHVRHGRSGGNGSLMRTAPVALAYLHDGAALADAARRISSLTHWDTDAGDACVLWCAAIQHAVLTGLLDIRVGIPLLPASRRDQWELLLSEAELNPPTAFGHNGWVIHALQAAWSAIVHTPIPANTPELDSYPAQHLQLALETAVRAGGDTDTVAAIAGGLLGARWGASAVPASWRRQVHGWPGLSGADLAVRGLALARGGSDSSGWPLADNLDYRRLGARGRLVRHPHDPGVWLADAAILDDLPADVDAVVSLCRVGRALPRGIVAENRVEVWLIDHEASDANLNLGFVLADAADTVAALRAEGRVVLLHCVAAQSRTPTAAAAYAIRHLGISPDLALREVCGALPDAAPNRAFRRALHNVAALVDLDTSSRGLSGQEVETSYSVNLVGICHDCAHRRDILTCDAFPTQIPFNILAGDFDHHYPYPGDNQIQFRAVGR